jgi:branched-chain amino acid aminotransferase
MARSLAKNIANLCLGSEGKVKSVFNISPAILKKRKKQHLPSHLACCGHCVDDVASAAGTGPGSRRACAMISLRAAARHRRGTGGERLFSAAAAFDASRLTVRACGNPQPKPDRDEIVFGRSMSDHMLLCDWTAADGWGAPRIVPHEPLAVSPACLGLHLGISCFEGMKAFRDPEGSVRLFRPDMNAARFQRSCSRVALPTADVAELTEAIRALVRQDAAWVPDGDGFSLYIRPVCFATEAYHGVGAVSGI